MTFAVNFSISAKFNLVPDWLIPPSTWPLTPWIDVIHQHFNVGTNTRCVEEEIDKPPLHHVDTLLLVSVLLTLQTVYIALSTSVPIIGQFRGQLCCQTGHLLPYE